VSIKPSGYVSLSVYKCAEMLILKGLINVLRSCSLSAHATIKPPRWQHNTLRPTKFYRQGLITSHPTIPFEVLAKSLWPLRGLVAAYCLRGGLRSSLGVRGWGTAYLYAAQGICRVAQDIYRAVPRLVARCGAAYVLRKNMCIYCASPHSPLPAPYNVWVYTAQAFT
jgi:hypothetical protein